MYVLCSSLSGCTCTYKYVDYVCVISQDFPSIYQVRQKLIDNEIITIFAVAEDNSSDSQYLYSVSGVYRDNVMCFR